MTIPVGTLCLCVSASRSNRDLIGRECVVVQHGPLYATVRGRRIAHPYRVAFKDRRMFLAFDRHLLPLLDPPIEITVRDIPVLEAS